MVIFLFKKEKGLCTRHFSDDGKRFRRDLSLHKRKIGCIKEEKAVKNFMVATVLFIIFIIATIFNAVFITSESNRLTDLANELPSVADKGCREALSEFNDRWDSFTRIASLTVSYSELNKIDCTLKEMKAHLENSNDIDFDQARVVLISSLRELSRHERISINSIF